MEFDLRALTEAEEKYTYSQSIRSKSIKIKQSACVRKDTGRAHFECFSQECLYGKTECC